MTETFDFVEACARMKADPDFYAGYKTHMGNQYLKICDGVVKTGSDPVRSNFWTADGSLDFFMKQEYFQYIPTVSGKEAICAFIDDPSLKVRCVEEGRKSSMLVNSCDGAICFSEEEEYGVMYALQHFKWTIENGKDK